MKLNPLCIALCTLAGFTTATAAPLGGAYYETFGSEIVAIDLANPSSLLGFKSGNHITNVAVGGDTVYYQDGVHIFAASANLSSSSLFHTNGVAPVDLAINVDGNAYYESFGSEIVAIDLANPSSLLGFRSGSAITNIMVGDGNVYFQDGVEIWRADRMLQNLTLYHTNGAVPVDIALIPPARSVVEPPSLALPALGIVVVGLRLRRRSAA